MKANIAKLLFSRSSVSMVMWSEWKLSLREGVKFKILAEGLQIQFLAILGKGAV